MPAPSLVAPATVQLCVSVYNLLAPASLLQLFAGELLALVGPLDPSTIAFDPSAPFQSGPSSDHGEALTPPKAGGKGGVGSRGTQTQQQQSQGGKGGR